jgi:hypothetical protein
MSAREDKTIAAFIGLFVLIGIIGIVAGNALKNTNETSPPDAATKEVITAIEAYYTARDIGGSWMVMNLHHRGDDIAGNLLMSSQEQQCSFLRYDYGDREQAISAACPAGNDKIWKTLGSRDLLLDVSCDGKVFYTHSCGQAHPAGTSGAAPAANTSSLGLDQAAANGDPLAQSRLGVMYAEGDDGKPRDPMKALDLYQRAAAQGLKPAQDNLAGMYQDGNGAVKRDVVLAYAWAMVSGTGTSNIVRKQLQPHMSNAQLREAKKLAAAWKIGDVLRH